MGSGQSRTAGSSTPLKALRRNGERLKRAKHAHTERNALDDGEESCLIFSKTSTRLLRVLAIVGLAAASVPAIAETESPAAAFEERSPWLLTPLFNVDPKLGTSIGALGGYLHYFDAKSRPSILAVTAQYTNTDSIVAGAFTKTSFDEDRQRLTAGIFYGDVKNDYSDYLGTGVPLRSNVELRSAIARYLYRVKGDWFVGVQGIYQNFAVSGETGFDDQVLDILGVRPYKSGGLGLVVYRDSRDSENMPTRGWLLSLNNMAYRESLGGEDDFDVYRARPQILHRTWQAQRICHTPAQPLHR